MRAPVFPRLVRAQLMRAHAADSVRGVWRHAALQVVYVLLFNTAGELLIQKRAQAKRIAPGQWDLSVAGETLEHGYVVNHGLYFYCST